MVSMSVFSRKNIIRWCRLALLIFLCYTLLWIPVLIRDEAYSLEMTLRSMVIDFIVCAVISFFNCMLLSILNNKVSLSGQSNRRIGFIIVGIILFNMMICFPFAMFKWWLYTRIFINCPWDMNENYIDTYVMSSVTSIIIISYMLLWVVSSLRQKEKYLAEAKIRSIKNKINPHFLFNNLNAGIALIDYAPEKAVDFFTSMSRVFRTVLERSMETTHTLDEELGDLRQYLNLLEIRFDNAIVIDLWLTEDDRRKRILAGSLQLVVEDIVKHNRFSKNEPMNVVIHTDGKSLLIVNDYRPLSEKSDSCGIGQSVIIERYHDFGGDDISFRRDGDKYISQLPLFTDKNENTYNRR